MNVILFCTIHAFLHRYWGSTPAFYNYFTTPCSLEVIHATACGHGWMLPVPVVSGADWFATAAPGDMGVIIVAALAQSLMQILCP